MGNFLIILAFFESVIFCLSVLMFPFIRVCSVSAISGSLFSNGSQMVCDHSLFLEKSVLLRSSNPPILSGSGRRLRSSSVIWFLPVILGSSCCPTFFSISFTLLKASGVFLVRKLNLF